MKKLLIMAVAACCLAACNKELYTFSEVYEYTVQEETDPEPMPNPEAN